MNKPTITVLIGAPLSGEEARFLRQLHADLAETEALILANFNVGERQIDFVVVTPASAAILELKNFSCPIFGKENGFWTYVNASGRKVRYPVNPYDQTLKQKYELSDAMKRYQHENPEVAGPLGRGFFSDFSSFVCVVPEIHPDSRVTPGDHKVKVRSYADVLDELQTRSHASSWTLPDWREFAERYLNLAVVSIGEATDPKVFDASQTLCIYRNRVKATVATDLPPLLDSSADGTYGHALIASAQEPRNHTFVGPSGSTKSFHLSHLALALADSNEEAPLLVEAKRYHGGDFAVLLKQATAPFHRGNPAQLLQSMRLCGVRPVLMIDALNECSEAHLPDLIRGAQAFIVTYDARVVLTSQAAVELPADLQGTVHHLPLPDMAQKRRIFAHHAGLEATPDVDAFCDGFTNAYDLTIAGRCHKSGAPPESRADLYDRYVRRCLGQCRAAAALLRHVAGEMSTTFSTSWSRDSFETAAEAFLKEDGSPLTILDDLQNCRLIKLTDDYLSFEHELLFDYFKAEALRRAFPEFQSLARELIRPRNQRLLELLLPRYGEAADIAVLLSSAREADTLIRVCAGHSGPRAKAVVLEQCLALMGAATEDLPGVELYCGIRQGEDGRRFVDGVAVKGNRTWSEYDDRLCELIARNLQHLELQRKFLELLDLTEWKLRAEARNAAKQIGLKFGRVWEETVRTYGGGLHHGTLQLPCVSILSRLHLALMYPPRYPTGLPIRDALLERTRRIPQSHFSLLMLLQVHQAASAPDKILENLGLVEQGLKSDIYILQVEAAEYLQFMQQAIQDTCPERVPQIHEMLNSVKGTNFLLNTAVLETLAAYDGIELSITAEDALQEMRSLIAPEAASDPLAIEAARVHGTSPIEVVAGLASSCLGKIFEDVFQGIYFEAYCELSTEEKVDILCLACQAPDAGFQSDWILRELHRYGGRRALSIYRRFAAGIENGNCFADDAVAGFVLGIEGCARWSDLPPPYLRGDSPVDKAWETIGEVLFWHFREPAAGPDHPQLAKLWTRFEGPVLLAAADVLYRLSHLSWRIHKDDRADVDLIAAFPDQVRTIVETCLAHRESLPSLFPHAGSVDCGMIHFLIETVAKVGDATSIPLLREMADDREFGNQSINAIESIEKKLIAARQIRPQVQSTATNQTSG